MIKYVVLSILFFVSMPAFSITNIESVRLYKPEDGLSGSIGINLSGESGDKEKDARQSSLRLDYTHAKHNYLGIVSVDFEEVNGRTSTDDRFAHLRYTYSVSHSTAIESYLQSEQDKFLTRDKRNLIGMGGRFLLEREDDRWSYFTGAGIYHTQEYYSNVGLDTEEYERFNFYLNGSWRIVEGISMSNTFYYQPRTNDIDDVYLLNAFLLAIDMAASLKLKFNHLYMYDSEPVLDLPKVTSRYSIEVAWQF